MHIKFYRVCFFSITHTYLSDVTREIFAKDKQSILEL